MEYKNTIITPKTDFPMKAGLPAREPGMLSRWQEQGLYNAMLEKNKDLPPGGRVLVVIATDSRQPTIPVIGPGRGGQCRPPCNIVISQLEVTSKWTIKSQSSPLRPTSP